MEKYPTQFVLLIEAETEDELHGHRNTIRQIGIDLPSYEEDKEGGLWKCIGRNIYHLDRKKQVRKLAKKLKGLPFLLFEDSSAIVNNDELDLPELLNYKNLSKCPGHY